MDRSFLSQVNRIVIKIGSSNLSGEDEIINDFLFELANNIKEIKKLNKEIIIVSSGAVSQGRKAIQNNKIDNDISVKQALAAIGQNKLLNLYESFFSKINVKIAQILFGVLDIETDKGYENLENTFQKLIEWGILPIVNENDSTSIDELKFGDNDILSAIVTILTKSDLLIILTNVDGFLLNGEKIDYLEKIDEEILKQAGGPTGPGTGGMFTKINAASLVNESGNPTIIMNSKERFGLKRVIEGEKIGTLIKGKNKKINLSRNDLKIILKKMNFGINNYESRN